MQTKLWLSIGLVVVVAGCAGRKDADSVLRGALDQIGDPASIEYSGTGGNGFFGQAILAGQEWPMREMSSFTRTIDYTQRAAREEMTFAQPTFGGQTQNAQVSGDKAWNVGANGPVPQPAAAEERQLLIWLTPHGFLKAARDSGSAQLTESPGADVVSFTALGKYSVRGTIDAEGRVTQVATAVPTPVLGDTAIVATYSGYRAFDGVQFPAKIVVTQGDFPVWDLDITSVRANAPLQLPVPEAVASASAAPAQPAVSSAIADGVWFVGGGSHHSVVVEFADYLAVVEAPLGEPRSLAVIEEAKRLAPGKPVRYVVTTHHHFDHTGGLRTYVGEGATVVTHQSNADYFEKAAIAPATLSPDLQSRNQRAPTVQGVADKYTITDGTQTIDVYATAGDTHTGEYTLVYLPGPKILVEGDAYSPGPPDTAPPATPPPNAVALYDDVQRLALDVATIAPIHGRGPVPFAEFAAFVGRQ
jgi:glyoxylase-like metal-dependent hydrolase (beta-lactamase superfamily II)